MEEESNTNKAPKEKKLPAYAWQNFILDAQPLPGEPNTKPWHKYLAHNAPMPDPQLALRRYNEFEKRARESMKGMYGEPYPEVRMFFRGLFGVGEARTYYKRLQAEEDLPDPATLRNADEAGWALAKLEELRSRKLITRREYKFLHADICRRFGWR